MMAVADSALKLALPRRMTSSRKMRAASAGSWPTWTTSISRGFGSFLVLFTSPVSGFRKVTGGGTSVASRPFPISTILASSAS